MLKRYLFLAALLLSISAVHAQEAKTFVVKAGTTIAHSLSPDEIYQYAAFTPGRIFFKDGATSSGRLNYHRLLDEMQFINAKGDTLAVDNEPTIRLIIIGTDSFYYDRGFVRQLAATATARLAEKQWIRVVDREKAGGYGAFYNSSEITSYTNFSDGRQIHHLSVKENLILAQEVLYFVGDRYDHFFPASRKAVLDLYPKQEGAIKRYFKETDPNFKNGNDLRRLFNFLAQL